MGTHMALFNYCHKVDFVAIIEVLQFWDIKFMHIQNSPCFIRTIRKLVGLAFGSMLYGFEGVIELKAQH